MLSILAVTILFCVSSSSNLSLSPQATSLSARLNYSWFADFLSMVLKVGGATLDGTCIDLKKNIKTKVWIYDVEIDINEACLNSVSLDRLGDDFYQVLDQKSKIF